MGGFIGLQMALDYPQAVNRLVLADTNGGKRPSCSAANDYFVASCCSCSTSLAAWVDLHVKDWQQTSKRIVAGLKTPLQE